MVFYSLYREVLLYESLVYKVKLPEPKVRIPKGSKNPWYIKKSKELKYSLKQQNLIIIAKFLKISEFIDLIA